MIMEGVLFKNFCVERNLSEGSIRVYSHSLKKYCTYNQMTLQSLIEEADWEEEQGIRWKKRTLKNRLLGFRTFVINAGFMKETIKTMMKKVTTFYRHYEIEVHPLPRINWNSIKDNPPITYEDLPDRELIGKIAENANALFKALILFMGSSGISRSDCLNLKVKDFINATSAYHSNGDVQDVLKELSDCNNIIPTWKLQRKKTKKYFYTFNTPEATTAIIHYLQTRQDKLTLESQLFKVNKGYVISKMKDLNDLYNLGKIGTYGRFRCHMLRKFHATSLNNDGLSREIVNALQGKSKNSVDEVYFFDGPDRLKNEYLEHINAVTFLTEVKTIKSPEFVELETKVAEKDKIIQDYESVMDNIDERIDAKIREKLCGGVSDDELDSWFS